jgi:hypothetical protein
MSYFESRCIAPRNVGQNISDCPLKEEFRKILPVIKKEKNNEEGGNGECNRNYRYSCAICNFDSSRHIKLRPLRF